MTAILLRGLMVAWLLLPMALSAAAETLHGAIAQAYGTSPDLREARADLRVVDERMPQARSGWRPTLSATASVGAQHSDSDVDTIGSRNLVPTVGQIDLTQPIYSGGETVALTRQALNEILAKRSDLRGVEQTVLLSTVIAYMNVLRDGARVSLNKNNEQVLQRQLQATVDRFEVGEVTRTDVAQAEARLARTVAERLSSEGELAVSRATYERVTGQQPEALEPAPPLPALPATLGDALGIGLKENPNIVSANNRATTPKATATSTWISTANNMRSAPESSVRRYVRPATPRQADILI